MNPQDIQGKVLDNFDIQPLLTLAQTYNPPPNELLCVTDGVYRCQHCSEEYGFALALQNHLLTHKDENNQYKETKKCVTCGYISNSVKEFMDHIKTHKDEKPHKCTTCGKGFQDACCLKRHFRIHTGEKPFQCEFCEKKFSDKSNLVYHIKVHTKEKPFQCEICNKYFARRSSLRKHERTHGEKWFKCKFCQLLFTAKAELQKHCIENHEVLQTDNMFTCQICKKSFSFQQALKEHLGTHKEVEYYECQKCQKVFKTKENLRLHINLKICTKCEICGKTLASFANMKRHLKTHGGARKSPSSGNKRIKTIEQVLNNGTFVYMSNKDVVFKNEFVDVEDFANEIKKEYDESYMNISDFKVEPKTQELQNCNWRSNLELYDVKVKSEPVDWSES